MEKLIIDRTKWYRGNGSLNSRLLTEDGTMCCLGFHALQCGASKRKIDNVADPQELINSYKKSKQEELMKTSFKKLVEEDGPYYALSDITSDLMEINDDETLTEKQREKQLTKLFKSIGIKVEFIN